MNTQEIFAVIGVLLVVGIGFVSFIFITSQFDTIDNDLELNIDYVTGNYTITTPSDLIEVNLPDAEEIIYVVETVEDGSTTDVTNSSSLIDGKLFVMADYYLNKYFMGYQVGPHNGAFTVSNDIVGTKANATASGLVRNITAYLQEWNASNYTKCALYYDGNFSLYTETIEQSAGIPNPAWVTFDFTTLPNVSLGTRWFIVITTNGTFDFSETDTGEIDGQGGKYSDGATSYDPLTSPLSWGSTSNTQTNRIYATVQPYNATFLDYMYVKDLGNSNENISNAFNFLMIVVVIAALLLLVGTLVRYR